MSPLYFKTLLHCTTNKAHVDKGNSGQELHHLRHFQDLLHSFRRFYMLYVTFEVQMDYEDLSVIRFNLLMFSFFLTCKDNADLKHLSFG